MRDLPGIWSGEEWWEDDGAFGFMPSPEPVGSWDEEAMKAYIESVFGEEKERLMK